MIRPALGGRTIGALGVGYKPLISDWWNPGGSFTCVAAYQAIGAASQAASYVNLVSPATNDLEVVDAPSWDGSDGWTFNGSTNALNIPISTNAEAGAWTLAVRYSNWNLAGIIAGQRGDPRLYVGKEHINFGWNWGGTIGANQLTDGASSGYAAAVIILAAGKGYKNGDLRVTFSGSSWSGVGYNTIGLGCLRRPNGSYDVFAGVKIQAVALYSTTLNATQASALSANMAAL